MRHPSVFAAATLAVVAVLAAGCGGSSYSSTNAASPASPYGETSSTAASKTTSATTPGSSAPPAAAVVVTSKHDGKLGTILAVGGKRTTVYMFEGDKGSGSSCTGACARVWPPVTTSGAATASGTAVAGDLGTIARPDGTMQVTYKGHPLYYFAKDKDDEDAYGEGVVGFGAEWYVLAPSGKKVGES